MRIVLDSNVFVAALIAEGLGHRVMDVVFERHDLICSDYILSEVENSLRRKLPQSLVKSVILRIRENSVLIKIPKKLGMLCRDPKDDAILATADIGKAELLITGDDDLLSIKQLNKIQIISPRKFIELGYED